MTKSEAICILQQELQDLDRRCYTDDLNTTIHIANLRESYEVAIDCIKKQMVLVPRWKTIKNNKQFFDLLDTWIKDENNKEKQLEEFVNFLTENIDIS